MTLGELLLIFGSRDHSRWCATLIAVFGPIKHIWLIRPNSARLNLNQGVHILQFNCRLRTDRPYMAHQAKFGGLAVDFEMSHINRRLYPDQAYVADQPEFGVLEPEPGFSDFFDEVNAVTKFLLGTTKIVLELRKWLNSVFP